MLPLSPPDPVENFPSEEELKALADELADKVRDEIFDQMVTYIGDAAYDLVRSKYENIGVDLECELIHAICGRIALVAV